MRYRRPLACCLLWIFCLSAVLGPALSVRAATSLIYADALGASWENWSWAQVDFQAAAPVRSGSKSIRVTFGGWDALRLRHPSLDADGYTRLRFFAHGGSAGGQRMQIYATFPNNQQGPMVQVPPLAANTWTEINIPLADLQAENRAITSIAWQGATGGAQPAVFIDDIALLAEDHAQGPQITEATYLPASIPADGQTPVVVSAKVTDPQGAGDLAEVFVDAGWLGQGQVALRDDGRSNDGAAGDGRYGAVLHAAPSTPSGERMLFIEATDQSGHHTTQHVGALSVLTPIDAPIPEGLTPYLGWGTNTWSDLPGQNWQENTGVAWDYVYQYITYEWYTDGWGGNFVGRFANEAWENGYIPVVSIYLMFGLPPTCGEGAACYMQKLQNPTAVANYLAAIEEAVSQAQGEHPVIFHFEPDFTGFLQQASNSNPPPAGVLPDDPNSFPVALNQAGYDNTLAGFGRYITDLVHQTAPNALFAPHASIWGPNRDVHGGSAADAIALAQRTATFLEQMGGDEADLYIVEWSGVDAGSGGNHWWDTTNVALPRPSRAILWKNAFAAATDKRMLLWQIPVGNMSLNDTCQHYRDNRAEYISHHQRDLFDAGVMGVLFGPGSACMTHVTTDGGFLASQAEIAYADPATPLGLSVRVTGNTASFRWNESTEVDRWGYLLQFTSGTGATQALNARRANSAAIDLTAGTWEARIWAYDAMGNLSPASAPLSFTIGGPPPEPQLNFIPILQRLSLP